MCIYIIYIYIIMYIYIYTKIIYLVYTNYKLPMAPFPTTAPLEGDARLNSAASAKAQDFSSLRPGSEEREGLSLGTVKVRNIYIYI